MGDSNVCSIVESIQSECIAWSARQLMMAAPLGSLQTLLCFHGLWPTDPARRSWRSRLRRSYPFVVIATALYRLLVVHMMDALLNVHDEMAVCQSTTLLFLCSNACTKMATLCLQTTRVRGLVRRLEVMRPRDRRGKVIVKRTQRVADLVVRYLPVYYTLAGAVAVIALLPEAIQHGRMQDRGWHPYDISTSPNYEATLLVYSLTIVWFVNGVSVCDVTIFSLGAHAIAQFRLLQHNLTQLRGDAGHRVPAATRRQDGPGGHRRTEGNRLHPYQSIAEPWTSIRKNQLGVLVDRAEMRATRTGSSRIVADLRPNHGRRCVEARRVIETTRGADEEMTRRLKMCVRHHRELTSWVTEFQSVFTFAFANQVVCNAVAIAVLGVYFSVTPNVGDPRGQIMIQLFVVGSLEFLCYCWIGSSLAHEGNEVKRALFDCDWVEASEEFKKLMRIVICKSNALVVVSIARFKPLSLQTFVSILQTTYNVYVFILAVVTKNRKS